MNTPDALEDAQFALMDTLTDDFQLSAAVLAVSNAARRGGWRDAIEWRDARDRQNRRWAPALYAFLALFSGAVGGAALYATIARNGWLQIIGYCAP